jgi:mannose-6-phosphate isomerase-like protein (cupin superfamily)
MSDPRAGQSPLGTVRKFRRTLAPGVELNNMLLPPEARRSQPFTLDMATIEIGHSLARHSHEQREVWVVTHGSGQLHRGDEDLSIGPGDIVYFQPGVEHQLDNVGDEALRLVSVYWA